MITPRPFDPAKPRELQVQLEKKWEVIGKDFAIEKVNNQTPLASENETSETNFGSRQFVKIVCMSDTHSTQGEFG